MTDQAEAGTSVPSGSWLLWAVLADSGSSWSCIYNPQGSLFCLTIPPLPPRLRGIFSRLPWAMINRLSLGTLLEELHWKFLWRGKFSTKLCACLSPLPFILSPSVTHPLLSPSLLVTPLQPSSESYNQRCVSGVEQRRSGVPSSSYQSPPPPVPLCFPCRK